MRRRSVTDEQLTIIVAASIHSAARGTGMSIQASLETAADFIKLAKHHLGDSLGGDPK
jgi:hypothetical protein